RTSPCWSNRMARELVVPWSMDKTYIWSFTIIPPYSRLQRISSFPAAFPSTGRAAALPGRIQRRLLLVRPGRRQFPLPLQIGTNPAVVHQRTEQPAEDGSDQGHPEIGFRTGQGDAVPAGQGCKQFGTEIPGGIQGETRQAAEGSADHRDGQSDHQGTEVF